jgi:MFS superfamily sulfate permease-like transporter
MVVLDCSAAHGVTIPMIDALRAMRDQLARSGVRLQLAEIPGDALESLRRSHWFADIETEGAVSPTVDAALIMTTRETSGPAQPSPEEGEPPVPAPSQDPS